ncbi:MAG: hypothetical protein AKCLJLPJ_02526 [Fimbriimonadales bacterium]|nr:hypothetical protein [Fimbriimonadales bacterium]
MDSLREGVPDAFENEVDRGDGHEASTRPVGAQSCEGRGPWVRPRAAYNEGCSNRLLVRRYGPGLEPTKRPWLVEQFGAARSLDQLERESDVRDEPLPSRRDTLALEQIRLRKPENDGLVGLDVGADGRACVAVDPRWNVHRDRVPQKVVHRSHEVGDRAA